MKDIKEAVGGLQMPVMAADANMMVFYANDSCKAMFKNVLGQEDFVGKHLDGCHPPESFKKLERLYEDFKSGVKNLDHYTKETPDGKITLVQAPFFKDGEFAGVIEYIFAGDLT